MDRGKTEAVMTLLMHGQEEVSLPNQAHKDFLGVESLFNIAAPCKHDLVKLLNVENLIHVRWKRQKKRDSTY